MGEALDLHTQFLDSEEFIRLGGRLAIDLFFALLLVFGIYARRHGRTDYVFTYVMFNLITFTLCFMLRQAEISIEFALGLFAVFGILRYRTEAIRIHELSYLFVVIGIAIVNAMANESTSLGVVLFVNGIIVLSAGALEFIPGLQSHSSLRILYDDLALLKSGDKTAIEADITTRTGLAIRSYKVDNIDLLKQTARITVYY
jgi:hypothetical protein